MSWVFVMALKVKSLLLFENIENFNNKLLMKLQVKVIDY